MLADPGRDAGEPMSLTRGMHHISATVSDVARTDACRRGLLGLSLVDRTGHFDESTMPHWTWGNAHANPDSLTVRLGPEAVA